LQILIENGNPQEQGLPWNFVDLSPDAEKQLQVISSN
jgi:hypothetical protein